MDVEKATAGTHASQGATANPKATPKRLDLRIVMEVSLPEGITRRNASQLGCVLILWTPQDERHSVSIDSLHTLTYPNCKASYCYRRRRE